MGQQDAAQAKSTRQAHRALERVVVIFTDSTLRIAIDKADKMQEVIEAMGGTVLEYVDTLIAETSQRMPKLTTSLLQRHGEKWTHSLANNDLYFDFMGPSLAASGIPGDGALHPGRSRKCFSSGRTSTRAVATIACPGSIGTRQA